MFNSSTKKIKLGIIGTGISGLSTAYFLLKQSPEIISSITFFEEKDKVGGVLQDIKKDGFLLEQGAQGVLLDQEIFLTTIQEIGLFSELIVPKNKIGTRYLIRGTHCVSLSPQVFNLLKHRILTIGSIFKILNELFFKKHGQLQVNESIYDFFAKHFGKTFADNFIIPLCFGIWGGGAKSLLMRFCFPKLQSIEYESGSLIRHFLFGKGKKNKNGLGSFKDGLKVLPNRILQAIENLCLTNDIPLVIHFNSPIVAVKKSDAQTQIKNLDVTLKSGEKEAFDVVVFTGQPWKNEILSFGATDFHKDAIDILKKIPTHSLAVVGIGGIKKEGFPYKEGFGALASKNSPDLLGILFIHSTYPNHVPENGFLYRILLGGDRNENIHKLDRKELLKRANGILKELNLISGDETITIQEVIYHPHYVPLATEYQDKIERAIWQLEALNPGLFFTGNYTKGVSVVNCMESAQSTANTIFHLLLNNEKTYKKEPNISIPSLKL